MATRDYNAPRSGTLSTLMQQSQPNKVAPTYTGRGVIPTVAGSNLPITDMTQLKLTPEGAAQRTQDLGTWNNKYMNSPVYNPGGSNTYSIQNGPQDSLLASLYGTTTTNNPTTNNPTTTTNTTMASATPSRVGQERSSISESGNPIYDSGFSLQNNYQNSQVPGSNGYLSKVRGQSSTRGNPYNSVYPWSNWKLWSN